MNHYCSLTQYHDYCTLRPQSSQKCRGRCLTTGPISHPVRRVIAVKSVLRIPTCYGRLRGGHAPRRKRGSLEVGEAPHPPRISYVRLAWVGEIYRQGSRNDCHAQAKKGANLSHQATAWLLWFSESRLADRLVLNVIAYHVSNDTGDAWPSIATIVEESALSERQVYDSIKVLTAMGELLVRDEPSERGTNRYHMPKFFAWLQEVHPAKSAGGAKSASCKPSKMQVQSLHSAPAKSADESSLESSLESKAVLDPNSNPEECPKCGTLGEHRCPGNLSQKQRDKRAGRKPGRFPVSRNRVSAHSFVTAADGTERPPRYERPAYKSFTPPPSVPEKLDDDYPDLKEILRRQNEGTL